MHQKNKWPFVVITIILLTVIIFYSITNNSVQIFDYDMVEQGVRFVIHGYKWFNDFSYPLWDWNHFFGASIFTHGYYFLFTPFSLFFNILPSINAIPYAFLFVNTLKLFLIFVTSYLYFSKIRKTSLSSFVGASILTFCGFSMGYYNYSHFLDTFVFVPLALYYIEDFINDRKFIGFTLTIMIMSIINGYFLYLFTVYFFIYGLLRYLMTNEKLVIIDLVKTSLLFLFYYLVGLGLGSLIFIPTITTMLGSSRLNLDLSFFKTINRFDLFRFFTGFLSPVVDRNNFNPFVNVKSVASYGWSGGAAVYSFIITPLLSTQFFILKIKKYDKILLSSVLLFFFILSIFPSSYVLLNGSNDTRWMVIFTLLLSYIITIVIDEIESLNIPLLLVTTVTILISLFLAFFISNRYNLQSEQIYLNIAYRNSFILAILLILYSLSIFFFKKYKSMKILLVLLIIFESYLSLYNIFLNPVSSVSMSYDKMKSYQITDFTLIHTIQDIDNGVYRIDAIEDASFNNSMSKNYLGFSFYSSVYNYNLDTFIQNNIASAGGWIVGSNPGKWQFKTMFGSKYWFDTQNKFFPPFGYQYLKSVKYGEKIIDIYENTLFVPFIYSMEESLSYETWSKLDGLHKMHTLMSNVVLEDSHDSMPNYPNTLFNIGNFGTKLNYKFETKQSHAIVYVSYPRSEEVSIELYLDDQLVEKFYSYEPSYSSIYTTKSFNQINVSVSNLYGVPEDEFINTAYIEYPNETYPNWHNSLTKEASSDIELLNNAFKASLTLAKEKWIVTSIAYDDNWNIEVNGQKVDIKKVNGGFIGFKGVAGLNQIEAHYFPRILIVASIIFISSLILFVSLIYKSRKKSVM